MGVIEELVKADVIREELEASNSRMIKATRALIERNEEVEALLREVLRISDGGSFSLLELRNWAARAKTRL